MAVKGIIPEVSAIGGMFTEVAKSKGYSVDVKVDTVNDRDICSVDVIGADISVAINEDFSRLYRGDEAIGTFNNGEGSRNRALEYFDNALG